MANLYTVPENAGQTLKAIGERWSRLEGRWGRAGASAASAQMGPESKAQVLEFKKVGGRWLLARWKGGL